MATKPSPVSLRPHHGYKSWTTDWYDEQGHRRTRRFGKEGEVTRKVARARFDSWLKNEYDAKPHVRNPSDPNVYTVEMLCDDYLAYANKRYVKNGALTTQMQQVRPALNALKLHFGIAPVDSVRAPAIASLRDSIIESKDRHGTPVKLTASTVNGRLRVIRQAFKWAAVYRGINEAIPYRVGLVEPVKAGRSEARSSDPVHPVADEVLEATKPHMPKTVADMVMVQYWTGMRPGEVCALKPCHLSREGDVWIYRPQSHKTEHHGKDRLVPIGPNAQAILKPYVDRRQWTEYLFLPEEAHKERLQAIGFKEVTAYQMSRSNFKPGRRFSTATYRNKVQYACDRAFDPKGDKRKARDYAHRWNPHQLRHNAATRIRDKVGLEAAQHVLGHDQEATSLRYAEKSLEKMKEAARIAG